MEAVKTSVSSPLLRVPDNQPSGRRSHFFSAKSHASLWRAIRTALVRAEGVILVVGAEGCGKTTLIKRLHGLLSDNRDLAIIPSADISAADFLQNLITATTLMKGKDLGSLSPVEPQGQESDSSMVVPYSGAVMTVQDLVDALEERVAMGRKLVLAVDQAHLLKNEQASLLDMMVRFVSEGIRPVQLVLSGRPELRSLIESGSGKNLAEKLICSCEVTPLTRREVLDYVHFQLERSMGGTVKVSWLAWVEIVSVSQGIPQKIDQLLKRVIPLAKQRNTKTISRSMVLIAMTMGRPMRRGALFGLPRAYLWTGGVILVAGLGYFGFGSDLSSPDQPVVKKGADGETSSYIQIFKPNVDKPEKPFPIGKPEKPSLIGKPERPPGTKEAKPEEEQVDLKANSLKKRYWEPTVQSRPEVLNLSVLESNDGQPTQADKSNPSTPGMIPEPESFRKRSASARISNSDSLSLAEPDADLMEKPTPPKKVPKPGETTGLKKLEQSAKAARSLPKSAPEERDDLLATNDAIDQEDIPPRPTHKASASNRFGESPEKTLAKPPAIPKPDASGLPSHADPSRSLSGVATEKSFRAAGKLYVVQIGSYATLEYAERLKKNLTSLGGEPYVHLFEKNKRRWFSVRINYRVREMAERMAKTINRQENIPTRVLELNYD